MRNARRAGQLIVLMAAGWGFCAEPPASAPVELTAAQRRALELVALGKARTELLRRVRTLPLVRDVTVGDWVSASVELDRALRLWVRQQPQQGPARVYSDGVCEVDVALAPEAVRDQVLRWLEDFGGGPPKRAVDGAAVQSAAKRWPMLWATGSAAASEHLSADRPAGWEDVSRTGMELARSAAEADAWHALLEEAGRLKVTPARRLREFLHSGDAVRDAVQAALRREGQVTVEFEPDQVAVATARIGMKELLRILTRVHQEQYQGEDFAAADFREMVLLAGRDRLTGTGLAPPPERYVLRNRYGWIEYDTPAWVGETRTATGRFQPEQGESPELPDQYEAARLDAIDQLRRLIEQLPVSVDIRVRELLAYRQDLKDDVVLFLSGARVVRRQKFPTGGVQVEVELPLRRLWEIVRRAMKLEEVEPPAGAAESAVNAATRPMSREEGP